MGLEIKFLETLITNITSTKTLRANRNWQNYFSLKVSFDLTFIGKNRKRNLKNFESYNSHYTITILQTNRKMLLCLLCTFGQQTTTSLLCSCCRHFQILCLTWLVSQMDWDVFGLCAHNEFVPTQWYYGPYSVLMDSPYIRIWDKTWFDHGA